MNNEEPSRTTSWKKNDELSRNIYVDCELTTAEEHAAATRALEEAHMNDHI